MRPVLKAKKYAVDQESKILNEIKAEKEQAIRELERYQKLYIEGIDKLNLERQSVERSRLLVLENSIDYAKLKWYESLRIMRECESKEQLQIKVLIKAQQDLHIFEKLEEKYKTEIISLENKNEQKRLDEHSINLFNSKR